MESVPSLMLKVSSSNLMTGGSLKCTLLMPKAKCCIEALLAHEKQAMATGTSESYQSALCRPVQALEGIADVDNCLFGAYGRKDRASATH